MKTVNWKSEFVKHDLFGDFDESERDRLLDPSVSQQMKYEPGETILREGEIGNSLFLIGSGEVEICIIKDDKNRIPVATLSEREIFGEMALFEDKPRAATVIAQKESVLLEIDGRAFVEILRDHPQVQFKIMAKLSERLRRVTEEVLAVKFNDLHQRFDLLNKKVDIELDLVRNSLTTAETMLTVTNRRAEEISDRAKEVVETTARNHERIFQAIKIVGLVGGIAVIALGAFGYETWTDVAKKKGEIEDARLEAVELSKLVEEVRPFLNEMFVHKDVFRAKFYKFFVARQVLFDELREQKFESAGDTFSALLNLDDSQVKEEVYGQLFYGMVYEDDSRDRVKKFLQYNLRQLGRFPHQDRFLIYYLLLAAYVMDDEDKTDDYKRTDNLFERYIKGYRGDSIIDYFKSGFASKFSPEAFQEYFETSEQQIAFRNLKKNPDGSLDAAEVATIIEDEEIMRQASERTDKIKEIWDRIP